MNLEFLNISNNPLKKIDGITLFKLKELRAENCGKIKIINMVSLRSTKKS